MGDLKKGAQHGSGATGGVGEPQQHEEAEANRGAEFGTSERATRGTDRDADPSGESKNQGHGHPDANRGESGA
jgi:hypothetical protein